MQPSHCSPFRAHFDIFMNSCDSTAKPQPQVYASCNFCGKSIANSSSLKTWNYMGYGMPMHYGRGTAQYSAKVFVLSMFTPRVAM